MKKFIFIALGLVFVGASFAPASEASRDVYHAYLQYQQQNNLDRYRPFSDAQIKRTNRQPAYAYRNSRENYQDQYQVRNQRNSRTRVGATKALNTAVNPNTAYRPFSDRVDYSKSRSNNHWTDSLRKTRNVTVNIDSALRNFATYENNTFSFQIPQNMVETDTQNHVFQSEDLEVAVTLFDKRKCGRDEGFVFCANRLAKHKAALDNGGQNLITSTPIVRKSHYWNTLAGDIHTQTQTFTQSLTANLNGTDKTMNKYFVPSVDGSIYMVEVSFDTVNEPVYAGFSKAIFNSFQMLEESI